MGIYLCFSALGPAVGGILYNRAGWHAPFYVSLGVLGLDLIGRLLMLECRHLKLDHAASEDMTADSSATVTGAGSTSKMIFDPTLAGNEVVDQNPIARERGAPAVLAIGSVPHDSAVSNEREEDVHDIAPGGFVSEDPMSPWMVIYTLWTSRRSATALLLLVADTTTMNMFVSLLSCRSTEGWINLPPSSTSFLADGFTPLTFGTRRNAYSLDHV